MAEKLIKNLLELLNEEYEYYSKLKELALEKKEILISNDIERLTTLLAKENEIVEKLEVMEKERIKIVNILAEEYDLEPGKIHFSRLSQVLPAKWQNDLLALKDKLLEVIEELHQQNEQNKFLIEEAIKLNDFSLNMLLKLVEPDNHTYKPIQTKPDKNKIMTHIVDRKG